MPAGRGQEHHGDDVLHDEYADGDTAIEGVRLTALLENLDHEHGAGEGQRERQQRDGLHALSDQHRHARHGRQPQRGATEHDADQHVHRGGQPHLAAQQYPDVELEPDGEQQQRDAQVGQHVQLRHLGDVEGVDDEARRQESHQRRQPNRQGEPAEPEGDDEIDGDNSHAQSPCPVGRHGRRTRRRHRCADGVLPVS